MPICTKCGRDVPGAENPTQDQSTFICEKCQDMINLEAWKGERKKLKKKKKKNPTQLDRLQFLERKIQEIGPKGE